MKMINHFVMKNIQIKLRAVKQVVLSATVVLLLAQCAEEEQLLAPPVPQDATTEASAVTPAETSVSSLTISGIYTVVNENADCSTCTFIVPADTKLVDGAAMNIKPGSVICLDKALTYGLLEFENLTGTPDKPIVITYCSK